MIKNYLKSCLQYLLPKQALTALAGLLATVTNPTIKHFFITRFIQAYGVNMQEAKEEDPTQYSHFNDFFIRHLKPECRPIAKAAIVSPVDGCISELGNIESGRLLQAKRRHYSLQTLLATDETRCADFYGGRFITLYLSPKDYHRVHMPLDATITDMIYVPGQLFSVQPATTRCIPNLFARNERLVVFCNTELGKMAMVLVGAAIVGAIGTTWHGDLKRGRHAQHVVYSEVEPLFKRKAEEMGYFKLGSTVILLFADPTRMQWEPALRQGDPLRLGQPLGNELPDVHYDA